MKDKNILHVFTLIHSSKKLSMAQALMIHHDSLRELFQDLKMEIKMNSAPLPYRMKQRTENDICETVIYTSFEIKLKKTSNEHETYV